MAAFRIDTLERGMMNEKLLNIKEVARNLDISEDAVKGLVEKGELPAYRIGGSFLRFKGDQIEAYLRRKNASSTGQDAHERFSSSYTFLEKLEDFLYYNDFYILSLILLILIALAAFGF